MAKTTSSMLTLGTVAPEFSLLDSITGKIVSLKVNQAPIATVIMFICNHCPYVKHINKPLTKLADEYILKKIRFIAINANDVDSYPDDSPENMKKTALNLGYPFPYLYDETQEVAKAYQAACTPDIYIFDQQMALVYRGQFDNSRLGNDFKVDGSSVREALDCLINNQPVPSDQKPSMGCNIKWKA